MILDQPVVSGSFFVTGSSTLVGNLTVTGSIKATEGFSVSGSSNITGSLTISNQIVAQTLNVQQVTSSIVYSSGSNVFGNSLSNTQQFTGSVTVTGSLSVNGYSVVTSQNSGSITVLSASYASTASYVENAQSSSVAISASYSLSSSFALTASYAANVPTTASYALTASYVENAISASVATSASYAISSSNSVSSSFALTASYAANVPVTSSYALTASYVENAQSASVATSSSYSLSSSFALTASYAANVPTTASYALTASYVENAQSSSVAISATYSLSSSFALSARYAANVPKTASYALTASYVENAISASVATSASNAISSSNSVSSSFALTASYAANVPVTSSYALTASYVENARSASVATSSSYSLSSSFALTASYAANVPTTASYALTASYVENARSSSVATSASYALTSSYSLSGTGFPFSGSAVITGSLQVTNLEGTGVRYVITDASGNIQAQTASAAILQTQQTIATSGQTVFSVTNGYTTGLINVFVNGTKLNDDEFTDTNGTTIVLATGSMVNDVVEFQKYYPASGVTNNALRQLTTFTATAGQSSFTIPYTPGLLDIYYNGARLSPQEYTANNGTSFTLATASAAGDILDVMVYSYQVGAFSGMGGGGLANQVAFYSTTSSISGSNNFTFDGSTLRVTGSVITSGSSTFVNIGPTILSGSLTVSGSITATGGVVISGSIASASYASNAELLDNLDSTAFVYTSSFNSYSSSMSTRVSNNESTGSVLTTASASFAVVSASYASASGSLSTRVTKIEGNYATTGSNAFNGSQNITGSLTISQAVIAQTLNVQQVTSSIVYSCGNNTFGCDINNIQQFTGSVRITGSLNVIGNACMTSVCSPAHVGGTFSGTTVYGSTAICGGTVSGTTGTFAGDVTLSSGGDRILGINDTGGSLFQIQAASNILYYSARTTGGSLSFRTNGTNDVKFNIASTGIACFACELTAKTLGTNDLILNNLNYECANYVDGTRGSWLIQEGACDLFIINQVSGKKYKFNLIEIK